MMKIGIAAALAGCLWLIALPGFAADTDILYAGKPAGFVTWQPAAPRFRYDDLAPDPARREALKADTANSFASTLRYDVHFRADGDVAQTNLISRYYTSPVGIRENGNLFFWVDAFSQKAAIEQAYTLLPDGRRIQVDPHTIQIVPDNADELFTDSFKVILPFAGLEPGAVAVLQVALRDSAAADPLPWSRSYYPRGFVPQEAFEVTLRWDEGQPEPAWKTDLPELHCARAEPRRVTCRAARLRPYQDDPDIRYLDVLPALVVGRDRSWASIVRQYSGYFQARLSGDDTIRRQLDALLKGARTPEEKIDRIHRFVSQQIRYVGLEQGQGGVIPRPTALTLKRRYGDCKDKTALFVDMARMAGLDAYPVLTSTDRTAREKLLLPATHYFNHMVACVKGTGGQEYCVDLTDPYSNYRISSASLRGAVRLDLVDGTSTIGNFPTAPYFRNKVVTTTNTFHADGAITEEQSTRYLGPNGAGIRAYSLQQTAEERRRSALETYHRFVSNTVDPTFRFDGLDDVRRPVTIRSTATYPDAFGTKKTPTRYNENDGWLEHELAIAQTDNKHHDYVFAGARLRSEYVNAIPAGYHIAYTGPSLNFESEFGSLRRYYEVTASGFRVISELSLPETRIPLAKIPKFNRYLDYLLDNTTMWVELERTTER